MESDAITPARKEISLREPATTSAIRRVRDVSGPVIAGPRFGKRGRPPEWWRDRRHGLVPVPSVAVSCRAEPGYLVVALSGALDGTSAPALREYLLTVVHQCGGRVVLDLSAVSYADVGGLTVMVGTRRRAQLLGGWLRVVSPAPVVADVLAASGLDQQLDIYASIEAAVSVPALA
jgi:anti-anti-sigma factor